MCCGLRLPFQARCRLSCRVAGCTAVSTTHSMPTMMALISIFCETGGESRWAGDEGRRSSEEREGCTEQIAGLCSDHNPMGPRQPRACAADPFPPRATAFLSPLSLPQHLNVVLCGLVAIGRLLVAKAVGILDGQQRLNVALRTVCSGSRRPHQQPQQHKQQWLRPALQAECPGHAWRRQRRAAAVASRSTTYDRENEVGFAAGRKWQCKQVRIESWVCILTAHMVNSACPSMHLNLPEHAHARQQEGDPPPPGQQQWVACRGGLGRREVVVGCRRGAGVAGPGTLRRGIV